jgi:hypothetical protein
MNHQFDELTKSMAQSVTRRAAFKKIGLGLAGMALAWFGLANRAEAGPDKVPKWYDQSTNPCCCKSCKTWLPPGSTNYLTCVNLCGFGCHK